MELILTGDLAKQLLTRAKDDQEFAGALAAEFLAQVDPMAMARYLLTREAALGLLTERLQLVPEYTLRELDALPHRKGPAKRGPRGGRKAKAAVAKPARARKTAAKAAGKPGKRVRLSKEQVEALKDAVRRFLKKHGWATRKQICDAAKLPTMSIYTRVMGELHSSGEVAGKGERAKRVYGLKDAGKKAAKTVRPAKAKPKKKRASRAPLLCPVPGCKGKAAPVFGMMCREHKDLPKKERDKLFAARRKAKS